MPVNGQASAANARRLVILADGSLDFHHGKTAVSLLRYRASEVVAVIDHAHAGQTVKQVLGIDADVPIVASMHDTFQWSPTAVLIGIAPRGGGMPAAWRPDLIEALEHGLDVISGLHFMLSDDPELSKVAGSSGARLIDVRRSPADLEVADLAPHRPGSRVITFVGSDCAIGKMTAALEVAASARARGLSAEFVATGQTGIMLEGSGIAVDRVIGDFMSGAVEGLVNQAAARADWIFVEGQGSLLHPAYSGVTLALLHGSSPDAMILVHQAGHDQIDEYPVAIPSLSRLVQIYEDAAGWVKPAKVVAIALNTRGLDDEHARVAIEAAEQLTGLPVADPVKSGGDLLLSATVQALDTTDS